MKSLTFNGNGYEYFKIWIVNILLTIITLGLFYPWAKVRTKRYFYGNTSFDSRNFEYHATGKQLFIGFLIAAGILIAYSVVQQIYPVYSLALLPLLFFVFPWVIWKSIKFNARVTSFSNVRFSFSGSLGMAYFCYLVLPFILLVSVYSLPLIIGMLSAFKISLHGMIVFLLIILSLVSSLFVFAFTKAKSMSYLMGGYRYGQGEFDSQLKASSFVKIILKTALFALVVYLILTIFSIVIITVVGALNLGISQNINITAMSEKDTLNAFMGLGALFIIPIYLAMIAVSLFISAYFQARVRKYVFDNLTLDDKITFESTLDRNKFGWLLVTNLLLVVVTFGLGTPWAKVRKTKMLVENTYISDDIDLNSYVTEQEEKQSALADQLGDAFDVGIDVAI